MFYIDLDELAGMKSLLLAANRPAAYSFRESDHFKFPSMARGDDLKQKIVAHLAENGSDYKPGKIFLLTNLRVLGYVFNPVSFYFCYDEEGVFKQVLAEVNNTYLEQKDFILEVEGDRVNTQFTKNFYVSPFIAFDRAFNFRISEPTEYLELRIDSINKENGVELAAILTGKRSELTNTRMLINLLRFPFLTVRIIVLIHYQALKLYLKRVPWFNKSITDEKIRIAKEEQQGVKHEYNYTEVV